MINKIYEKFINFIKENYKILLLFAFVIFLFYYEFPYVIYKPGGIIDLSDRIVIDKEYESNGSLNMSYVTSMKGSPANIIVSFFIQDWDIVPIKDIISSGDYDTSIKISKEYLSEGIDNAIIAAFNESNYGITINREYIKVIYVSEKANTDIEIGDEIKKIDGRDATDFNKLKEYINSLEENTKVSMEVENNGKTYERYAIIYKDVDDSLKVGIAFHSAYDYETEVPISIKMKSNESGSSGGLMMALSIYNALTPDDITKGLTIVGTGSITKDGVVEEIGGVKYKVLGAERNNATLFLCPEENYEEAMNIKKERNLKIKIVKINTLKDAIDYLKGI